MRNSQVSPQRKTLWLAAAGSALLAAGISGRCNFRSSRRSGRRHTCSSPAATACILLAILHQIVDVWGARRWATVFTWIGANAIALYFLNELLSYQNVAARIVGADISSWLDRSVAPGTGDFVIAVLALSFAVMLARYLYTRKIFVRV